jgi:hypothetical protein
MPVFGLEGSHGHQENGMIKADMVASMRAADHLDEVIIFRSTGPWSRRWIFRGYPTKNFHVKGKSSDWGPQAGFVPYQGIYSKVGANESKAADGTKANDKGLDHHFASKTQLMLTRAEIQMQLTEACERPARTAIQRIENALGAVNGDLLLWASRSGDGRVFVFRAVKGRGDRFAIAAVKNASPGDTIGSLSNKPHEPLEVMTSSEVGADNRPMTGDYDLMAVCPRWGNLGSRSVAEIRKGAVSFSGKEGQRGQSFPAGTNLDKPLTMKTNTGQIGQRRADIFKAGDTEEHPDMGNITPRILRAVNTLNQLMGGDGPFRRVHHNAESHRNWAFAALKAEEMERGDGFPLTVFMPQSLIDSNPALRPYSQVSTLLTMTEFRELASLLNGAGIFLPRNQTWGMSIRDRVR